MHTTLTPTRNGKNVQKCTKRGMQTTLNLTITQPEMCHNMSWVSKKGYADHPKTHHENNLSIKVHNHVKIRVTMLKCL